MTLSNLAHYICRLLLFITYVFKDKEQEAKIGVTGYASILSLLANVEQMIRCTVPLFSWNLMFSAKVLCLNLDFEQIST